MDISIKKSKRDENKKFYKLLIFLCFPIIVQNLISSLVNLVDTVMISNLGYNAIASIGIANQFYFLLNMVLIGITGGASVFISQFFGSRDMSSIKKVTGFTFLVALCVAIIFGFVALFVPEIVINIFSKDPVLIKPAKEYFAIISFAYPVMAISMSFANCSRAVHRPYLGMLASCSALVVNIVLNYGLILGNLGMPRLEIRGAAIATLCARLVEMLIVLIYVYKIDKSHPLKFGIENIKSLTKDFLKKFLSKSIPVILNDTFWALGTIAFSVAFSITGNQSIAIGQIASTTSNIFLIITVCLASGGAILIGNELGAGRIESAIKTAKKIGLIIFIISIILGLLLILSTPIMLKIYHVKDFMQDEVRKVFLVLGSFLFLKASNTFIIISVLRSGGDTKMATILEMCALWGVAVPLTFYLAKRGMPMHILVFTTQVEEMVKIFLAVPRALSKKWAVNLASKMNE